MYRLTLAILVSLFFSTCSDKNKIPKGILPQLKMREVMRDMILADEFVTLYIWKNDSAINRLGESVQYYDQIFLIHGIKKEQFQKSLSYYRAHPDFLKTIVDSLNAKMNTSVAPPPLKKRLDTGLYKKNSLPVQ